MPVEFDPAIEGSKYTYFTYVPVFIIVPNFLMGTRPNRIAVSATNANGRFITLMVGPSPDTTKPFAQLEPGESRVWHWDEYGNYLCQQWWYNYTLYTTSNNTVANGNLVVTEIVYTP